MLRPPTMICYCLVGVGIGMLTTVQLIKNHNFPSSPTTPQIPGLNPFELQALHLSLPPPLTFSQTCTPTPKSNSKLNEEEVEEATNERNETNENNGGSAFPNPRSLYGYGCHVEEPKPIMRGLLHLIASWVCISTLLIRHFLRLIKTYRNTPTAENGKKSVLSFFNLSSEDVRPRHPSDFVMSYFSLQYFASSIYHRHLASPSIVSTFTTVDIGWICATIIGSSLMVRLKKLRHVLYAFIIFVSLSMTYEVILRGLTNFHIPHFHIPSLSKPIHPGEWITNLMNFKNEIHVESFIYSYTFEPWIWVGLKAISGISFALIPIFSPTALNYKYYDGTRKVLFFLCGLSYACAFFCFYLQTVSRKNGMTMYWHMKDVWGYHEDFHFILIVAHTFTSHLYDTVYENVERDIEEYDREQESVTGIHATKEEQGIFKTVKAIVKQIEMEYKQDYITPETMKKLPHINMNMNLKALKIPTLITPHTLQKFHSLPTLPSSQDFLLGLEIGKRSVRSGIGSVRGGIGYGVGVGVGIGKGFGRRVGRGVEGLRFRSGVGGGEEHEDDNEEEDGEDEDEDEVLVEAEDSEGEEEGGEEVVQDYSLLKVTELRAICRDRGLETKGLKRELILRLER